MVVGNSLSGQDISMELVEVAKEVHLSAKSLNITEGLSKVISKHENLHLHPQVIYITVFFFHNLINIYSDDIFMINLIADRDSPRRWSSCVCRWLLAHCRHYLTLHRVKSKFKMESIL